ncbi:MAG: UDP-N-acetylmuramoylalanine--D-glutamate ligase [Bradyrhizobium sp.]|jgi:UDP-N-acetylmuramoylalanine--D-glutamate ligase
MNYAGKQVLVLGLGESGLAMALWLARCGAQVRVADTRVAPERLVALRAALPDVDFRAGEFTAGLLTLIDFVAVSPGLGPRRELLVIAAAAADRDIPLRGEIELFAHALASLRAERAYAPKLIAITGTNGKTTVTSLAGLLCERAGLTVQVAGNISPSALDVLRACLDDDSLPQVWVLELSSFQLHTTISLQADAATVLNISQDHLDWHGDMETYVADKARIFGSATIRVLNRDDAAVMQLAGTSASPTITFGSDEALTPDCFGLLTENGMQWLAVANEAEAEKKPSKRGPAEIRAVSSLRLMPVDALKIRGQHNALNALAALALCRAIGLPLAPLLHGLRDYHGEPHRVELVTTLGGVTYFDDSKGTNVGATVAALTGLGMQQQGKLILIAGGEGKGQDFTPLAAPVARHARAVLLIGKDADAIRLALAGKIGLVELVDCSSLDDAVEQAAALAQAGDAVLLSPACASFDMFRNYAHRAEVFVDAVRELALSRGEVML